LPEPEPPMIREEQRIAEGGLGLKMWAAHPPKHGTQSAAKKRRKERKKSILLKSLMEKIIG